MANRNFNRMQSLNKEVKMIAGRCDETGAKEAGLGFSVSKTGTGQYTIVLEDSYPVLLSAQATVLDPTSGHFSAVVISADPSESSKTIVIETVKNASPTDLPANSSLHFAFFLQNSTVPAS